ncbi:SpaA isopeptide-forming pilin-related protein [Bifidobacterium moraviense]|nr:SpaA isopeptide-forming pilin-related protein [Bifidobacterium sp. DSM 109958]
MKNGNITNKPTEATWSKTDVNGAKLAGSQWKLVRSNGVAYCVADDVTVGADGAVSPSGTTFKDCPDGATTISDHAAGTAGTGVITVKELPAGIYTLTETKAPAGYQVSMDTYTLVIRDDSTASTITKNGSALVDNTVTDEALPVDVEIPVRKTVTGGSWPKTDGRYVPFRFAITGDSDDAGGWPVPKGCDNLADCIIDLAPADHATDPTQAVASFGKLTFTDAQLSDEPGSGGDYAKTYTYKIAEVAGSDPFVTYSKAEYRLTITVSRATDESGAHAGIKAHAVLVRVKDDDGNAASGDDATVGEWTVTSGDAADAANAKATAFTNAVSGPVLPATGGAGTVGLTVAGAIAVLVASAGLAVVRRPRR